MNTTLIAIIIIVIAIIIAVIILIVVLTYKGSSPPRCTANGQCASGDFCNADGFCVQGTGAGEGATCSTTSNCIIGLVCTNGTCQVPSVPLTPANNNTPTPTPTTPTTDSTLTSTSGTASNNFLTSNGKINVVDENNTLSLTDTIPDDEITDLENSFGTNGSGIKPRYVSTANSFSGQTISINTSEGKYYLQINPTSAYWIHSDHFSSASNIKLSYDKLSNTLSVNSRKVYIATSSQSTQIKFSSNKYYLQTNTTNNDSRLIIERSSNGYYVRTPRGMYLTIDLTGAEVIYAKYPAILTTFDQLSSTVELSYLNIGSYVKK